MAPRGPIKVTPGNDHYANQSLFLNHLLPWKNCTAASTPLPSNEHSSKVTSAMSILCPGYVFLLKENHPHHVSKPSSPTSLFPPIIKTSTSYWKTPLLHGQKSAPHSHNPPVQESLSTVFSCCAHLIPTPTRPPVGRSFHSTALALRRWRHLWHDLRLAVPGMESWR